MFTMSEDFQELSSHQTIVCIGCNGPKGETSFQLSCMPKNIPAERQHENSHKNSFKVCEPMETHVTTPTSTNQQKKKDFVCNVCDKRFSLKKTLYVT